MTLRWVAATRNPHKLEELRALLPEVELMEPPAHVDPQETGTTFEENALIKAREVHHATGEPSLADDSGIEVDALEGGPGVHSARFAGPAATDVENLHLLLARLEPVPPAARTARYRCVVALVESSRETLGYGSLEGMIVGQPRGDGGFGYDPVFVPESETRTVGEMTTEEKHLISHRARAVADLWNQCRRRDSNSH